MSVAAENLLAVRTDPASLARDFPAGRHGGSVMPESIVQNEQEWLTRSEELISYRGAGGNPKSGQATGSDMRRW